MLVSEGQPYQDKDGMYCGWIALAYKVSKGAIDGEYRYFCECTIKLGHRYHVSRLKECCDYP